MEASSRVGSFGLYARAGIDREFADLKLAKAKLHLIAGIDSPRSDLGGLGL